MQKIRIHVHTGGDPLPVLFDLPLVFSGQVAEADVHPINGLARRGGQRDKGVLDLLTFPIGGVFPVGHIHGPAVGVAQLEAALAGDVNGLLRRRCAPADAQRQRGGQQKEQNLFHCALSPFTNTYGSLRVPAPPAIAKLFTSK